MKYNLLNDKLFMFLMQPLKNCITPLGFFVRQMYVRLNLLWQHLKISFNILQMHIIIGNHEPVVERGEWDKRYLFELLHRGQKPFCFFWWSHLIFLPDWEHTTNKHLDQYRINEISIHLSRQ